MQDQINAIHQYWFGPLDTAGFAAPEQHQRWFTASNQTDTTLRTRFGGLVDEAVAGELTDWPDHNDGLIALVLLLDQFTRNIYRGTPGAFSGDDRALQLAQAAIHSGRHLSMPAIHQVFLLLPLEHCEDLKVQDECVRQYRELALRADAERVNSFTRYAEAHRDVIAEFGRFPHRNVILGRESSAAEHSYLDKHGGF